MTVPPGLMLLKRKGENAWVLVPLHRITLVEELFKGGCRVHTLDHEPLDVESTISAISLMAGKMLKYVVTETTPEELTALDLPWESSG